ncbi:MAG TPA: alpha/beta hydrolase [Telluria sp.]|nr:alpha/beta hydrolase [Telluria sp.]
MTKLPLHFAHANSYPAGTYKQYFAHLRERFEIGALDMHGHDPRFPVEDGWRTLSAELIHQLESYPEPVVLVGHSLGGMLSMMAAKKRPELVRCVVMLDSPLVAGWRAMVWRLLKNSSWADRYTPAKGSVRRRNVWPSREAAFEHFSRKDMFAAWAPGVLDDYLEHGLKPHPEGVQLRFTREVETAVYRSLPHHLGKLLREPYPVPIGFIGGTESVESRQAGLDATRALVGENFMQVVGGHLFPMERPAVAAQATADMVSRLLLK